MRENKIQINGEEVGLGITTTIRVAMESLAVHLQDNGLGDDPFGKSMTEVYLHQIERFRKLMLEDEKGEVL